MTPVQSGSNNSVEIGLGAGLGGLFLICFAVLFAVIYCFRMSCKKYARRYDSPPPTLHSMKHIPADMQMIENGNYVTQSCMSPRMLQVIDKFKQLDSQISKDRIRYIRQIGQGNFGVVFMGKMSDPSSNAGEERIVAVKTLKDDYQEALEDFAREAKIMLQLDHPNIITLYGVCTEEMPYYLVFEHMDLGDLSKFLRDHASSRQRRLMDPTACRRSRTESTLSDDPPSLSHNQLSDLCKQVASGMQYLSERSHVHRDLACRNCLVKSCPNDKDEGDCAKYIVKIGDFGMSHDLYQRNYYRVEGQAVLPVRWMSPEAIIFGKFSTAGDVWSFGVTMWEIFSFAMQPYYGISNEEVMKFIRKGRHLNRPPDCPEKVYVIMQQCWNLEPDERPSFKQLQDQINEFRSSLSSESSDSSRQTTSSMDSICEEDEDNVFLDGPLPLPSIEHAQVTGCPVGALPLLPPPLPGRAQAVGPLERPPPPLPMEQGHAHNMRHLQECFVGYTPPQAVVLTTKVLPDGRISPYDREKSLKIQKSSPVSSSSSLNSDTSSEETHL